MFGRRYNGVLRTMSALMALATGWFLFPAYCFAKPAERPKPVSLLAAKGLTQTPDAARQAEIAAVKAKAAKAKKPQADVRALSSSEMKKLFGRGPLRYRGFNGTLPWQRSLRDVNLCNGNLFKSFTDIQIAPGRGQGLVLQRTYNSNDDREGAFGTGWTHAYEIRMEEAGIDPNDETEKVVRTDFFGGKHTYTRDADGLYTPPPYLFDETESKYDEYIVNGPAAPLEDSEKGMDGTVKHFVHVATNPDSSINHNIRACDYIEDRHGNRTTLTYGFTATYADGSTEKKVTEVTDPVGRTLTFTWANLGTSLEPHYRITEVEGPVGTYRVTYDYYTNANDAASYGNLWKVHLDPDGLDRVTTYTYAAVSGENGLLAGIADPLGHSVSYEYGQLPYLQIPVYPQQYTPTLWVKTITEPGTVTTPQIWTITASTYERYTAQSNSGIAIYPYIDGQLRIVTIETSGYSAAGFSWTYYGTSNNVAKNLVYAKFADSYTPHPIQTLFTYGPHGNVLTQSSDGFSGSTATTTYYNASKYFQKASTTDALGHVTTFDYYDNADPAPGRRGEVKWVRDAGYSDTSSPSYNKQFDYDYNAYGQKVAESNLKGIVTRYAYGDIWGNLTQVTQDPSEPSLSYTGLNRVTGMTYDVAGRVVSSTDPKGSASAFSYNSLGQPLSASFAATTATPAETVSYVYGANGRTDSVTDNRGTTAIAYETGSDRVASVTDPVTGAVSFTYGIAGERLTRTLPGVGTTTYAYSYSNPVYSADADPNGAAPRLLGITDEQGRTVEFTSDTFGRMRQTRSNTTYDSSNFLVSYQSDYYQYDQGSSSFSRGLLYQRTSTWNYKDSSGQWHQQLLHQNSYVYDDNGQRTSNQISTPSATTRTEVYGYDDLSRLTSVNYGDGQTQGYAFDAMGNRTQKTDSATGTETYTVDAANRLTAVSSGNPNNGTYTNDANGNTLTGGGKVNTWDSQNRLVKVVKGGVTSEFEYGCDGLRRSSLVTDASGNKTQTDYVYDGSMVIAEVVKHFNSSNVQVGSTDNVTYLQGASGPLYRKSSLQTDPKWYVYDGLGSVVGEVDVLGNLSATKTHDVYGLTRNVTGTPTSRQGFVGGLGHVSDDETGLIYMRARYYDPSLGRFASEDPARDGSNWFTYCANNPINNTDRSGESWERSESFKVATYTMAMLVSMYLSPVARTVGAAAYALTSALIIGFHADSGVGAAIMISVGVIGLAVGGAAGGGIIAGIRENLDKPGAKLLGLSARLSPGSHATATVTAYGSMLQLTMIILDHT